MESCGNKIKLSNLPSPLVLMIIEKLPHNDALHLVFSCKKIMNLFFEHHMRMSIKRRITIIKMLRKCNFCGIRSVKVEKCKHCQTFACPAEKCSRKCGYRGRACKYCSDHLCSDCHRRVCKCELGLCSYCTHKSQFFEVDYVV